MNKSVYAIFTCDEWKTKSSMRLIAIADDDGIDDVYLEIMKEYDYDWDDIETYTCKCEMTLNTLE